MEAMRSIVCEPLSSEINANRRQFYVTLLQSVFDHSFVLFDLKQNLGEIKFKFKSQESEDNIEVLTSIEQVE